MKNLAENVLYRVYYKDKGSDFYWYSEAHEFQIASEIYDTKRSKETVADVKLLKETTCFEIVK